ncbi:MAG: CDP-glucose 4,6-dehydratase [Halobacteriovoraceae bacterium]|jgi:CDP-glucose 4,6-dehydratase|nr:CDP-glucose 4,6-dehydratase [Halobacteriovoraceae bacterium]MBT5095820.1 CDP-glucose 4,6-dehydratase [Halobacteriovoraceae bacterium]
MFRNIYQNKKVVITGHTGFKGSWLCAWLTELGAEVYGYSIDIPTVPSHFEALGLANKINHNLGDVRDREQLNAFLKKVNPDFIFHLAAKAIVRECYDNPHDAFATNSIGSLNMLSCLKELNNLKACVMITSDKAYENVEWEYGYREDDKLGGKDPYSASKACAEIIFSSFYRSYLEPVKIKVATARAGNVIGGGDWGLDRIVPDCMRAWSEGQSLEVRSPGATRPWQHVLEPLSGYLQLAASMAFAQEDLAGESFNFGPASEVNQPVSTLIDSLKGGLPDLEWHTDSTGQGNKKEAGLLKLCCDKALFHLDWLPTFDFSETVSMISGWYKNYYKGKLDHWEVTVSQIKIYQELAKERNRAWTRK